MQDEMTMPEEMDVPEGCTHDCSTCGAACASRQPTKEDLIEKLNPMSTVKKAIGVVSGKGGVGKSLVTSLLAVMMQRRGYKAAVLDADVTGPSIPKVFGLKQKAETNGEVIFPVRTETGIDVMSINLLLEDENLPVVWRGPVVSGAVKQFWSDVLWEDVDFMLVDMPPGTGDVPLTVFQSLPLDGIIVVTSPQELVAMIVNKSVNMAEMMDVPVLGVIENMSYLVCPDCGKKIQVFGESNIDKVAKDHGLEVLGKIPMDAKLAAGCDAGQIERFEGDWLEKAADVIEKL